MLVLGDGPVSSSSDRLDTCFPTIRATQVPGKGSTNSMFPRNMERKILFLTTASPDAIKAARPCHQQNALLPEILRNRGIRNRSAQVDVQCWRNSNFDAITISDYDIVTFLWCGEYYHHPKEFRVFVEDILMAAQRLNPSIHIINSPEIVLWNMDKQYLKELADKGFQIPRTEFVDIRNHSRSTLQAAITSFGGKTPVVLKPTMSGSAKMTSLIKDPQSIGPDDEDLLELAISQAATGDLSGLILQEYADGIREGEYSVIFINGRYSHTVLKTPRAGEFRCQVGFGGSTQQIKIGDVPKGAVETSRRVMAFVQSKFGGGSKREGTVDGGGLAYLRIDGILREKAFILMEVEAIEPELWLDTDTGAEGLEQLCEVFLR